MKSTLAIVLFVIIAFVSYGQSVYYVDTDHPNASDGNPGTESLPWSTIQHGVDTVMSGSSIIVKPGSYGRTRVSRSGSAGMPITITGETVPDPLASSGNVTTKGFYVEADHIVIQNVEITDIGSVVDTFHRGAVNIVDATDVIIRSCYIHELECANGNWGAVRGDGDSIQVLDNTIYRVEGIGINIRGTNWLVQGNDISHGTDLTPNGVDVSGDADAVRFFGSDHVIRDNYLHDYLRSEASQVNEPHMDAFQTYSVNGSYAYDIMIEGNVIENFGAQGLMVEDDDTENNVHHITMQNNIFMGLNGYTAINVRGCEYFSFLNNLVIDSGVGIRLRDGSHHARVLNNIFYQNSGSAIFNEDPTSHSGSAWDHNLHFPGVSYPSGYSYDLNSLNGVDPLFLDMSGGDYHLRESSQAINAGVAIPGLDSDIEELPRPVGSGWDIGPYEFQGAAGGDPPLPPSGLRIVS